MQKVDVALRAESPLGEGALWDDRLHRLLWVDILLGEVHSYDPASGADRILYKAGMSVGTVVQRERGGLVTAQGDGIYFVDEATGQGEKIASPEPDKPQNRFNDGKCDPAGRLWAGTMGAQEAARGAGSLYCLDAGLTSRAMIGGLTVPNGIAWSADARRMYFTDSHAGVVWAYDYDKDTGAIGNCRVVAEVPKGEGVPDGFTLDAEETIWLAQWGGRQVGRYDPRTGKKIGLVDVPAAHVTSCALGGANLDELYITTARAGRTPAQLAEEPLAGGVFVVKADTVGMRANRFRG